MNIPDIPIVILNMKERQDRKAHMEALLEKMSLSKYEFVVPVSIKEGNDSRLLNPNAKPSKKSHQLSMIRILESMKHHEFFIIMEDDIEPRVKNVIQHMQRSFDDLMSVDPDFDILSFETCFQNCFMTEKITENLRKTYDALCGGCRLYSRKGATRLLQHIYQGSLRSHYALDHYIAALVKSKYLTCYHNTIFRQKSEVFGGDLEGSYSYYINSNSPVCVHHFVFTPATLSVIVLMLVLAVTFVFRRRVTSCLRQPSRYATRAIYGDQARKSWF